MLLCSDEELYREYLERGKQEALRCLFDRYSEGLMLFLFGYVHSMEDAEELMIDSFAEVAVGPTVFSGRSSFKTWLFSVGKHQALMFLRKRKREQLGTGSEATETRSPELDLLSDERKRHLYLALERVADDYRMVLWLRYIEDMSIEEIAGIMKKRVKQIYNLTDRGKQTLKKELEKIGFEYEQI